MARLKAGWVTLHCSAARVKFNEPHNVTKYRTCDNSMCYIRFSVGFAVWTTLAFKENIKTDQRAAA